MPSNGNVSIPQCSSGNVLSSGTSTGLYTWEIFLSGSPIANSTTSNGWSVTNLAGSGCTVYVPDNAATASTYNVVWLVSGIYYTGLFNVVAGTCPEQYTPTKKSENFFFYKGVLSVLTPYNAQNVVVDLSNPTPANFDLGTWEATYIGIICSTPSNVTSSGFYPPDYLITFNGQPSVQVSSGSTAYIPLLPGVGAKGTITLVNISAKPSVNTPVTINLTTYR